jgi:hypothetical protein
MLPPHAVRIDRTVDLVYPAQQLKVSRENATACETYIFPIQQSRSRSSPLRRVRLSEGCVISGCFGHAMRPRFSMVAGS